MITNDKCNEYYSGVYKKGMLGKKYDMKIFLYTEFAEVVAFYWFENELSSETGTFKIDYEEISDAFIMDVKGDKGILIEFAHKEKIVSSQRKSQVVIMGINKANEVVELIINTKNRSINRRRQKEETRKHQESERKLRIIQEEESAQQFFDKCYEYHINKNENPYYDLLRNKYEVALIYIDKDKNLNFLRIDGYNQEESNGVIPFSKIHYYERAGSIHYTTEINGAYSSFGGSITGVTFSKKATFWGGLLLGPMGMAGGALLTHKPSKTEMPNTELSIESDIRKVDDRNIILNYYSDAHKQYIDIELPMEVYNFLQTHIPEKKYEIVMELEKKSLLSQSTKQIDSVEPLNVPTQNSQVDDFKAKIEKLKMMYDMGILTDIEFDAEKKKLLESI